MAETVKNRGRSVPDAPSSWGELPSTRQRRCCQTPRAEDAIAERRHPARSCLPRFLTISLRSSGMHTLGYARAGVDERSATPDRPARRPARHPRDGVPRA